MIDATGTTPVSLTTPPIAGVTSPQAPAQSPPESPSQGFSGGSFGRKKPGVGPILAGLFLLLVTLPLGVFFVAQQKNGTNDIRSKAALCMKCGAGTCPNGLKYSADDCAPVSSCGERVSKICGTPSANSQQITPTPTALPVSAIAVVAGSISGKICRDTLKDSGAVFFFNTSRKTMQFIAINKNDSTYTKRLIPGAYAVEFQSDVKQSPLGYTDAAHNLKIITVGVHQNILNIDLCDPKAVAPGENFKPETDIL